MLEDVTEDYNTLLTKYQEMTIFSSAQGISLRSQQLALLSGIGHIMASDPEIGRLLGKIEQDSSFGELNALQKRNLYLIHKGYDEQVALPESLVTEIQRQSSLANNAWKKAKAANNWHLFQPYLERNIELSERTWPPGRQ